MSEGKPLSKSAQKKAAKAAAKAKRKAENAAKEAAKKAERDLAAAGGLSPEELAALFGDAPVVRSVKEAKANKRNFEYLSSWLEENPGKEAVEAAPVGKDVWIRARISGSRLQGSGLCFLELRQRQYSLQAVSEAVDGIPKAMVRFIGDIPNESIVDFYGSVKAVEEPIKACTIHSVELRIKKAFIVSRALTPMPMTMKDLTITKPEQEAYERRVQAAEKELEDFTGSDEDREKLVAKVEEAKNERVIVPNAVRLDHRTVDLRTAANQGIFRLQSGICALFREFLLKKSFVEIHSPKMIGAKSEGGAEVFTVQYFKRSAYLAQSPQFYKQMSICSDLGRVFEIGPVFRAENSISPRHMTEFIGMDMEMAFEEHYHEVLDVMDEMFYFMLTEVYTRYWKEIELVSQQYPVEKLSMKFPSPRLTYQEGCAMLQEAGFEQDPLEDLSRHHEIELGKLVKAKYDADFYQLDKFPASVRPFYTMLDPENQDITNSYDFMIRGQEIMSGAQRIHDLDMLLKRAEVKEVEIDTVQGYLDAFKYGAWPHAGGGIGLERVVMLLLGLDTIRMTSLFPRTPTRLYP